MPTVCCSLQPINKHKLLCLLLLTPFSVQAVADFTTVLKLDPTNVNAYFNRGSAYDSLGQYEKAVADYTHALDLDNSSPDPDRSAGGHSCHMSATWL